MNDEIKMTKDAEYFLKKAKKAIEFSLEHKDVNLCLKEIRQAEMCIEADIIYLESKIRN
jgi:hypothetical protein